jgi:hypothetical protein
MVDGWPSSSWELRFQGKSNRFLGISTMLTVSKLKILDPFSKEKPNWSPSPPTSATTTGRQVYVPPTIVPTSRWTRAVGRPVYFLETRGIERW